MLHAPPGETGNQNRQEMFVWPSHTPLWRQRTAEPETWTPV